MRVLLVDTGVTMRGGQWQVLHLAEGLARRGVEFRLLARGELLRRAAGQGIAAEEAGWGKVRRMAREFDVLHAHDARSHTWCATRHPLIVSRRVAFPVRHGVLSRWKYRQADLYLAVSQFVAGRLREAGVEERRIRVVYDGSPGVPEAAGGTVDARRIVAPESADPMKGSQLLRESGLAVTFSSNLTRDLPGAGVFVYLSREEGLGSAVLLAQSCGVPVVASRVGGLPELVEHERTGLLVDHDPAQVRVAVERLLSDDALRARVTAEARLRFAARFTIDHMVDATMAAYREVAR